MTDYKSSDCCRWPFSAQAIERTMGNLTDAEKEKVLGTNAQRLFGFKSLH